MYGLGRARNSLHGVHRRRFIGASVIGVMRQGPALRSPATVPFSLCTGGTWRDEACGSSGYRTCAGDVDIHTIYAQRRDIDAPISRPSRAGIHIHTYNAACYETYRKSLLRCFSSNDGQFLIANAGISHRRSYRAFVASFCARGLKNRLGRVSRASYYIHGGERQEREADTRLPGDSSTAS